MLQRKKKARRPIGGSAGPIMEIGQMTKCISIALSPGRKRRIPLETYHAAKRAIRIYPEDARVLAYAGSKDIDLETIAWLRGSMTKSGELKIESFSRRREIPSERALRSALWRA